MTIPDAQHAGCVKVGDATVNTDEVSDLCDLKANSKLLNQAAKKRIDSYTKTISIAYRLLHTEMLVYFHKGQMEGIRDHMVHDVLKRSGIKQPDFGHDNQGREWYCCDVQTVINAIKAAKEGRAALNPDEITIPELSPKGEVKQPSDSQAIIFRDEQIVAIEKTVKHFGKGGKQMLWNAKMRFGKTLTSLEVVRRMQAHRTLILTHRPVVDEEWFTEYSKVFNGTVYRYGSKNKGHKFADLELDATKNKDKHYIYFASMQDMRGSELVGGIFDKNVDEFKAQWDLLIVDEAHEGTQTELGQNVIALVRKDNTKMLSLSGTPFNLLDDYSEEEIFTWDYVMEQRAKADWDKNHFGDPNPYASLPRLNIFTFDLYRLLNMSEYEDIEDKAFNFREFFKVQDGQFVHEKDVKRFLDLIVKYDKNSNYPYANEEFRKIFRHSLWMVPGVQAARCLSELLKNHEVFGKFNVVNVAGEGDDDVPYDSAKKMVLDAIGNDPDTTYTITLSCGRLTTGVTIKPWTAVFMLSGSHSSDAKAYMQTIFRVQSPWEYKGRVKEECYCFDFAPDRTLKVIAETAKISAKAGKTSSEDKKIMSEFLNFCPVIACNGTKMNAYDTNMLLEQLKRAYIDRVIRRGFDDVYIYSDKLLQVTGEELLKFDKLKKIIGTTKAMAKTQDVDLAKNGMTEEEYKRQEEIKKKPKKLRTPEEEAELERLKAEKNQKGALISILRGISVRVPLLIYGAPIDAKEEITMATLPKIVDDISWEEFMPSGVTKEMYAEFVQYYDEDIIRAAARQIRDTARAADALPPVERVQRIALIFSHFHNPDKETVLTPWRVVNMHMSDTLGGYDFYDESHNRELFEPRLVDRGDITSNVLSNPETKVLEINSKTGLYPLYVAFSIYKYARQRYVDEHMLSRDLTLEEEYNIWDSVITNNLFVICKTQMARSITKRTLVGYRKVSIHAHAFDDLINQVQNNKENLVKRIQLPSFWNIKNTSDMLKFNAVVGNPPYQLTVAQKETDNGQKRVSSIFHIFQLLAENLGKYTSLIYPGVRWIHRSGKGLEQFGMRQINDPHLSRLVFYPNASDIFDKVSLADGISIVEKNMDKTDNHFEYVFVENGVKQSMIVESPGEQLMPLNPNYTHIVNSITNTVRKYNFTFLHDSILSQKLFAIESDFVEQNPTLVRPLSEGAKFDTSCEIKLLTNDKSGKSGRAKWYIANRNVINAGLAHLDKWKVVVSSANAGGQKRSNQLEILDNYSAFGRVKVALKTFDTEAEARNFYKFVDSKLIRFAFLLTDEALTSLAKLVPDLINYKDDNGIVDFSHDIDSQLFNLFGITSVEQEFIQSILNKKTK